MYGTANGFVEFVMSLLTQTDFYEQNIIEQISIEKLWTWVHYFINQYK